MKYEIKRSNNAIDNLLNFCAHQEENGETLYPGMTYEEGVKTALEWVMGDIEDHPTEGQVDMEEIV